MNHLRRQLLTLAVLTFLLPGMARACSCSGPRPIPFNLLLKESGAIFVGTVTDVEDSRYTFAVSEAFAGTSSGAQAVVYEELRGFCDSPDFEKGKQYLVYAYQASDGALHATICSRTQLAAGAEILLRQLRAAKENKPVASLYGTLRRSQQPYDATWSQEYEQPIANTGVHFAIENRKSIHYNDRRFRWLCFLRSATRNL